MEPKPTLKRLQRRQYHFSTQTSQKKCLSISGRVLTDDNMVDLMKKDDEKRVEKQKSCRQTSKTQKKKQKKQQPKENETSSDEN